MLVTLHGPCGVLMVGSRLTKEIFAQTPFVWAGNSLCQLSHLLSVHVTGCPKQLSGSNWVKAMHRITPLTVLSWDQM